MLRTIVNIAMRHLLGRPRQTLTTLAGVAVSTMVLITTISLTRGLLDSFVETIVDAAPHITLKGEELEPLPVDLISDAARGRRAFVVENIQKEEREEIRNYRRLLDLLDSREFGRDVVAASPYVTSQVMVVHSNRNLPVLLKGVDIAREDEITGIEGRLTSGTIDLFLKTPGALLVGRTVARDLGIELGDEVTVVPASGPPQQCKVAGCFFTGINAVDNSVLSSLKFGQIIERFPANKVSGIALKVRDPLDNKGLASSLEGVTGYKAPTWQEENASVLALFTRIGYIVMSLVGFVGVVSGFGVANILITTIFEKSRDIAIMKSLGFSARSLVMVFVLEGFLVGLSGALAGGILSIGSINLLASFPVETSQGPLTKTGFSMSWNIGYFLLVIGATVVISTVAAFLPSTKAARLEPVEVLRDSSL